MEFKEWYRILNFSREKVRYKLKDGDDATECLAEHRILRSDNCENYIDISDILSISDDRLEIRKFKPYGNLENTIEEYYDSSIHISKESLLRMLRENAVFVPDPAIKDINALVVIGSRERRIMLRSARRLSKMIEGSRIRILHGYSHGELSLEHPNEYAELLMKMIYGKL